ncbi:MAG TPA: hypothetical protein VFU97_24350 [Xanthobacteraceae bacterium]|nr:hypothetical protein [Xanthobacteraceae bacterium]
MADPRSPAHRHRPAGTGSIARKRLASGRMRFETHAPATDGQRRGKSLGTFDTEREAQDERVSRLVQGSDRAGSAARFEAHRVVEAHRSETSTNPRREREGRWVMRGYRVTGPSLARPREDGDCKHEAFSTEAKIGRITEGDGGPVVDYMLDVRVHCTQCGRPFAFKGLPVGLDFAGATMSVDGLEGHFAIYPAKRGPAS